MTVPVRVIMRWAISWASAIQSGEKNEERRKIHNKNTG
jgi:hypothetical protein